MLDIIKSAAGMVLVFASFGVSLAVILAAMMGAECIAQLARDWLKDRRLKRK